MKLRLEGLAQGDALPASSSKGFEVSLCPAVNSVMYYYYPLLL